MYGTSPQPTSHKEGMQISFDSIHLWCMLLILRQAMNSCTSRHLHAPVCVLHMAAHHVSLHVLAGVTPGVHKVLTVKFLLCNDISASASFYFI